MENKNIYSPDDTNDIPETFEGFKIKPKLLKGIYGKHNVSGFERPTILQSKLISSVLKGHDILIQGGFKRGKTTGLIISVLERIDHRVNRTQALILTCTRELAWSIHNIILAVGKYLGISVHALVGGASIREEIKKLSENDHQILVGTPGRVYDFLRRGFIKPDFMKLVVLDDAEELLCRGFQDQIKDVIKLLPNDANMVLSMYRSPPEVLDIARTFSNNLLIVEMKEETYIHEQYFISVPNQESKIETLIKLTRKSDLSEKCLVFCNHQDIANTLVSKLKENNLEATNLIGNGNINQKGFIVLSSIEAPKVDYLVSQV